MRAVQEALALTSDEILRVSVGGSSPAKQQAAASLVPKLIKGLEADSEGAYHVACALTTADTACKTASVEVTTRGWGLHAGRGMATTAVSERPLLSLQTPLLSLQTLLQGKGITHGGRVDAWRRAAVGANERERGGGAPTPNLPEMQARHGPFEVQPRHPALAWNWWRRSAWEGCRGRCGWAAWRTAVPGAPKQ